MSSESELSSTGGRIETKRRYWRRTASSRPWWPWGLLPLLGLVALFLAGVLFTAPRIEAEVRSQVADRLDAAGFRAAAVSAGGQGVVVEAAAPAEDEIYVQALARSTQCSTWAGMLTCPTSARVKLTRPAAAPAVDERRPHRFAVIRREDDVRLTGEVPDIAEHDRLLATASARFGRVTNELTISNTPPVEDFPAIANHAIAIAGELRQGQAAWSGEALTVTGVAGTGGAAAARERFNASGVGAAEGGFSVRVQNDRQACNERFAAILSGATVRFRSGSAEIDTGNDELLESLAALAASCPGRLTVAGHTDSQGDAGMNESLSLRRALAVRAALAELGIDAGRITARGFGESQPIADNATPDGRARNRRIEITATDPD